MKIIRKYCTKCLRETAHKVVEGQGCTVKVCLACPSRINELVRD